MRIIGIDPGKTGWIVCLSDTGSIIGHHPMPIDTAGDVDHERVFQEVKRLSGGEPTQIFLERAMPMAMGSKHAFNYGRDFKAVEVAVKVSAIPFTMVEPSKWCKAMYQGIDARLQAKAKALIAFEQLMPGEKDKAPRGPKTGRVLDGFVDAALIAEYGRRFLRLN